MAAADRRELALASLAILIVWTLESGLLVADRERGAIPLIETQAEVSRTRLQLAELEKRRDALRIRDTALVSDSAAIEAAAREELGMVFPGERMLKLPEQESR